MNRFLLPVLCLALASCRTPRLADSGPADGRAPLEDLTALYKTLAAEPGWTGEKIFVYPDGAREEILAFRTKEPGPALWLLSGIHGEEPAGPNAVARELESVKALARAGVPVVLIPLANPRGYRNGWRYPNTQERDWRKGGYSVGDAEWLLPDLEAGIKPRVGKPAGPETAALTSYALRLTRTYPPLLAIDLHEDELSAEGGYIYSQGDDADENPVGAEIIRLLQEAGIPLRLEGKTRFGEPLRGGVVSRDDKGQPIRDGSIDELLSAKSVFEGGKEVAGPGARTVIVVETPAFAGSDLPKRVGAHAAVLRNLDALWRLAARQ